MTTKTHAVCAFHSCWYLVAPVNKTEFVSTVLDYERNVGPQL